MCGGCSAKWGCTIIVIYHDGSFLQVLRLRLNEPVVWITMRSNKRPGLRSLSPVHRCRSNLPRRPRTTHRTWFSWWNSCNYASATRVTLRQQRQRATEEWPREMQRRRPWRRRRRLRARRPVHRNYTPFDQETTWGIAPALKWWLKRVLECKTVTTTTVANAIMLFKLNWKVHSDSVWGVRVCSNKSA